MEWEEKVHFVRNNSDQNKQSYTNTTSSQQLIGLCLSRIKPSSLDSDCVRFFVGGNWGRCDIQWWNMQMKNMQKQHEHHLSNLFHGGSHAAKKIATLIYPLHWFIKVSKAMSWLDVWSHIFSVTLWLMWLEKDLISHFQQLNAKLCSLGWNSFFSINVTIAVSK